MRFGALLYRYFFRHSSKNAKLLFVMLFFVTSVFLAVVVDYFFPVDTSRFQDISIVVAAEDKPLAHVFQTKDEKWRLGTSLKDVDSCFIKQILYREDRYFWLHNGINPFSLLRATSQWLINGKVISGGSTLTMQVARLLEPRPRTLSSKFIEIFRSFQLEWHFTKSQLLQMYLTLAPYGGNIEGIQAASWRYFGKSAQHLSPSEAALLIALPQAPRRYYHHSFTLSALQARNRILVQLHEAGFFDKATLMAAQDEPLPGQRFALPRYLPHLAYRLKRLLPQQKKIETTVQISLQNKIQHLASQALNIYPSGVNIAVLVVHHPTHNVLAYLGSVDFFSVPRQGQIDYIRALRSPGSTLKPFIYGLGFEEGIIHPDTLVRDDEKTYGNYKPSNFDKEFHGMVTIENALLLSLNIPVVTTLQSLGPLKFLGILEEVGITPVFPDPLKPPGLSLALGGVGMTLEQLTVLYQSLADRGEIASLRFTHNQPKGEAYQLFLPQTAALLTQILQKSSEIEGDSSLSSISFKTGTSYGHRDAWVVGYNASHVVGIWIGRPDGAPFGTGTGASLAVPLMKQIFQILPAPRFSRKDLFPVKNASFQIREVQKVGFRDPAVSSQAVPLQLLFPIHDTTIEAFAGNSSFGSVSLQAVGGKRPYTWVINQVPYACQVWRPKTVWTPSQKGFYTITLLDAQGQSKSAHVEIN